MAVKVLFFRADNRCQAESIGPFKRHIMMQDGDHPMTPKCVLKDAEGKLPSLIVLWQGIPGAEGNMFDTTDGELVGLEAEIVKQHRQKISISRRWVRRLFFSMILFGKMLLLFGVMGFIIMLTWLLMGAIF